MEGKRMFTLQSLIAVALVAAFSFSSSLFVSGGFELAFLSAADEPSAPLRG